MAARILEFRSMLRALGATLWPGIRSWASGRLQLVSVTAPFAVQCSRRNSILGTSNPLALSTSNFRVQSTVLLPMLSSREG
jgi:hypothetical protein